MINSKPQSIVQIDIIKNEGVIAGSLNINAMPMLTKKANIVSNN
jgi:hypothetical protein